MRKHKFRITKQSLDGKKYHIFRLLTEIAKRMDFETNTVLGVSEFTGLTDMNDNEIYENDIDEDGDIITYHINRFVFKNEGGEITGNLTNNCSIITNTFGV